MPSKNIKLQFITIISLLIITGYFTSGYAATYYVDINHPNADDNNPGTIDLPWKTALKGFTGGQAGDTIYFRAGEYRQNQIYQIATGTENARIFYKGYPGEEAIITSSRLKNSTSDWTAVPGYPNVYSTNMSEPIRGNLSDIILCSQDRIPLQMMPYLDPFTNGGPEILTASGQWSRDVNIGKIYAWFNDNINPTITAAFIEIGEYNYPGDRATLYGTNNLNYATFEDLTIEGGYYPISIAGNYIEIKNCTFRNFYGHVKIQGDAIPYEWNSEYGLIEGCDIYHWADGGIGIDLTGGDYWTIRNNDIHHGEGLGLLIKNNSKGIIVENNSIHDINTSETPYGYTGISIGGATFGGYPDEAEEVIVRNNLFYNLTGGHAVMFMSSKNCEFYNNIIYNCDVWQGLIAFSLSHPDFTTYINTNPVLKNNIFSNNVMPEDKIYIEWNTGCVVNLASDYNLTDFSPIYAIQGLSGNDMHSIIDTPNFMDAGNNNFHPESDSPVIDAGIDLTGLVDVDYDGVVRPQGNGWDIGPYEFQSPLAVDYLAQLQAIQKDDKVLLQWTTTNEQDNEYFLIERAQNAKNWTNIGHVASKGNSSLTQTYKIFDSLPPSGDLYYRLKQIAIDGSFSYSNIAKVYFEDIGFSFSPNPSTGKIEVRLSKSLDTYIEINELTGKQLFQKNFYGDRVGLDISHLPDGVYLIVVKMNGRIMNKKLILQR